jgi:multisubunit Na+/H+ antiporter MnhE subunit
MMSLIVGFVVGVISGYVFRKPLTMLIDKIKGIFKKDNIDAGV